jgi:predicted NUDIX family phosphoesterase
MSKIENEVVLVVPSGVVRAAGFGPGWNPADPSRINDLMANANMFIPRLVAEDDPRHRQIIPYLIVQSNNHIFWYRRSAKHADGRLAGAKSLGVGGHLNPEDCGGIAGGMLALTRGAVREFAEEVQVIEDSPVDARPVSPHLRWAGVIVDDSNPVGRVHLGIVGVVASAAGARPQAGSAWPEWGMCPIDASLLASESEYENWSRILIRDFLRAAT